MVVNLDAEAQARLDARTDSITHTLMADVSAAFSALSEDDTQRNRRTAVRVSYAAIEGLLWGLKQSVLETFVENVPIDRIADVTLLREETFRVNDRGKVRPTPLHLPLADNIRFVEAMVRRINPESEYQLNFNSPGWSALKLGVKARNRLMHPKALDDLHVSDEELEASNKAFFWFVAFLLSAKDEVITFLEREFTNRVRARLKEH